MALVRLDEFVARYPEFKEASCGDLRKLVESALAEAEVTTDECVFGNQSKYIVMRKAAAILSVSEFAASSGIANGGEGKKNRYQMYLEAAERAVLSVLVV